MKQVQKGFTLIELMIVIAIIGILAAIAVPQYSQYTRRATFSEVKLAVSPIKTGIEICYQRNGQEALCAAAAAAAAAQAVPGQVTDAMLVRAATSSLVNTVAVSGAAAAPIITVTPNVGEGLLAGDTYVLTGTVNAEGGVSDWTESGGACINGYC